MPDAYPAFPPHSAPGLRWSARAARGGAGLSRPGRRRAQPPKAAQREVEVPDTRPRKPPGATKAVPRTTTGAPFGANCSEGPDTTVPP